MNLNGELFRKPVPINEVLCGDCLDVLDELPDNIVDLTIAGPPYDNLRDYNGYNFDFKHFKKIAKHLFRITKKGGVLVWIVGDATIKGSETGTSMRQALFLKERAGFKLYDSMIFHKENPLPKNHRRYEQSFDNMYILVKGELSTFHPILEKCKHAGKIPSKNQKYFQTSGCKSLAHKIGPVKETKIRGNVWSYVVGGRGRHTGHPAPFPKQLIIDHIVSWSNEFDLVFDPFAGSGTTLEAAKEMNRYYLGCDISQAYCDEVKKKLNG